MIRKIFTTLLTLLAILSLVLTFLFAYDVLGQYEETMNWQQNILNSDIHKAPPNLAKNYIPPEEQELYVRLTDVNQALEEVEADETVKVEKLDQYWEIHNKAKVVMDRMTEEDSLPEGTSFSNMNRLEAYLKAEEAIQNAYDTVDSETLDQYAQAFAKRLTHEEKAIDRHYLQRLRELAVEFVTLEEFSKEMLNSLGVVEQNILRVDIRVTRSITDNLLTRIENENMERFNHIKKMADVLRSVSWDKILTHNTLTRDYYSWKESQEILEALLFSNYIPVSEFDHYERAIQYDPSQAIESPEGYELDIYSPVTAVYYKGERIAEGSYIRKGIPLRFDIDYLYTEIEVEEVIEEVPEEKPEVEEIEEIKPPKENTNQENTKPVIPPKVEEKPNKEPSTGNNTKPKEEPDNPPPQVEEPPIADEAT